MYEIRKYTKDDKEKILDLWLTICLEEFELDYGEDLIRYINDESLLIDIWVAEMDGEILGTVCYTQRDDNIAEIKKMYIKKDCRKLGLGKQLMNTAIDHIKSQNYESIYVQTNDYFTGARNFYEKLGFNFKNYEDDGYVLEMKIA